MLIKLLNPKIDYVFKKIFGSEGNEKITAEFLSCILKKKVTNVVLNNNPILDKDLLDDKIGILDIKAKIDNKINCDIEMQVVDNRNVEKRILFYWGKMYTKGIKAGDNYDELQKSIVVLIADYELKVLNDIPKYITKWNIREEEYSQVILTDVMELYIIELPKFRKNKQNIAQSDLNNWIKFIEDPEVIDMSEEEIEELKEARKILEDLSQDEHTRYLAEQREIQLMDKHAIEGAGFDKGIEQGIKQGIKQTAKKLKEKGIDINIISETTGLSIEEIKNLD